MSVTHCFCILLLATSFVLGQEFRSSITGVVSDQQGAGVPSAPILATQLETGAKFPTTSTEDGHYTLTPLPPGTYSISIQAPGFKQFLQNGIRVNGDQRLTVDVRLELGAVSESVTITADAPLLETRLLPQDR
jgi:Carboxypeptidase regulatory-like domain